MPNSNQSISFAYGLQSGYDGILEKDLDTIYFTTDTHRMYVGETEYTRPIQHGDALPEGYLPPNSLFVQETGSVRDLYYSKDGASWEMIAHLPAEISGGVFGQNTPGSVDFGGSIKIPQVTVDTHGAVTAIEDITITLPSESAETPLSVETTGEGNAVTQIAVDGHKITVTSGETFATRQELTEAIGEITDFTVDSNGGSGYESLDALQLAHPTGENGVFYLVVNPDAEANNAYLEYFWTGTAYELAGQFGSTNTGDLVTSEQLSTALEDKVDKTTTVNGQPLSGNVQITTVDEAGKVTNKLTINGQEYDGSAPVTVTTTDTTYTFQDGSDGSFTVTPADGEPQTVSIGKPATAGTADTLATPRQIAIIGDAAGSASFDGSADATITLTVSQAANATHAESATTADSATTAESATKATQDGDGNVISTTYATKEEVTAASLKWTAF